MESESEPSILEVQKLNFNSRTEDVHEGKKPFKCNPYTKSVNTTSTLNVLTINVRGIECNGRIEQVRSLLVKYQISIAVLSESHFHPPILSSLSL